MAQTRNLSSAQVDRLMGEGPSCVVVIWPPAHTQEDTAYIAMGTGSINLPDNAWQPLPLVSRLSIDLLYAKPDNTEHPVFTCGGGANSTLAALALECDPTSASFGTSDRTAVGGVAFRYADPHQKLAKAVLQPLESFITERMTAIKKALAGPEGIVGATEEYKKLEPKAFKMAFKVSRRAGESVSRNGLGEDRMSGHYDGVKLRDMWQRGGCAWRTGWIDEMRWMQESALLRQDLSSGGPESPQAVLLFEGATLYGSALAWSFFSNLNSVLGNYATLGLNISDFARYAKKPSNQNCQAIAIPTIFTIVGLLGIFTAAASAEVYGHVVWDPVFIIEDWSSSGSHSGRAASAFGAIGLLIVTLGINISANSISAANDLVSFMPKYINIRRGQLLAAFIGAWPCVPWKILASSEKFLAFLDGYTIFLGPMTAILMTDYYICRRGNVSVPDMYDFQGIYRYSAKYASDWRAAAALILGFAPPLPGFLNSIITSTKTVKHTIVSKGGQDLFAIGYIYSFIAAGLFYWVFVRFFPHHESQMDHAVTGDDIIVANDLRKASLTPPNRKIHLWRKAFIMEK